MLPIVFAALASAWLLAACGGGSDESRASRGDRDLAGRAAMERHPPEQWQERRFPPRGSGAVPIADGQWQRLPRVPQAASFGFDDVLGALTEREAVVVAGSTSAQRDEDLRGIAFELDGSGGTVLPPAPVRHRTGFYTAVSDGSRVFVWGGCCPGDTPHGIASGAAYDSSVDEWARLPKAPFGSGGHTAVWTGEEMIVWGGVVRVKLIGGGARVRETSRGAAFDPEANRWRQIANAPLSSRTGASAVWTGEEMIVWGGWRNLGTRGTRFKRLRDGAAYDPRSDSWRPIPDAPISSQAEDARAADAVWTGRAMLIWTGQEGATFSPRSGRWRVMAPAPLDRRADHSAVWSGEEMIVWGGVRACCTFADGATYDPRANRWKVLPKAPLKARRAHAAIWSGQAMLVWGGQPFGGSAAPLLDGAMYVPSGRDAG